MAEAGYASYDGPQNDGLRIGSININSLPKKLNIVADMINYYKFDVLMINETQLKRDSYLNDELRIPGYKQTRHDRPNKSKNKRKKGSGGLIIYIRDTINLVTPGYKDHSTQDMSTTKLTKYFQYFTIQLNDPSPIHLVSVYKSPNFDDGIFCERVSQFVNNATRKSCSIMFLGDFNMNDGGPRTDPLPKLKRSKSLNQLISHDTFLQFTTGDVKPQSGLHDLILTNQVVSESGVIRSAISDHDLIYCTMTRGQPLIGDVSAHDIAHARNVVLQSAGNINHLASAIYQDSIRELGEAKCRYMRSEEAEEIKISSRVGRHTREKYMRPYISVPPSTKQIPEGVQEILRGNMCPLRSLFPGDVDEGTNNHIVNGLCDIFNSLLDAPPVEVSESELSRKLFDTFEFMLLGITPRAQLTTELDTRSALSLLVKESLEAKKLVYGCFYKFDAVCFNVIASLLPDIENFPRDRMRNYFREREYCGAKFAHSPLFHSLLQGVKDKYSEGQIQVFACRNELAICINYTKEDFETSELQLRKVLMENRLLLSIGAVHCMLFRKNNPDKSKLLKEYGYLDEIEFLSEIVNKKGEVVE